jgi:hypothetical protein
VLDLDVANRENLPGVEEEEAPHHRRGRGCGRGHGGQVRDHGHGAALPLLEVKRESSSESEGEAIPSGRYTRGKAPTSEGGGRGSAFHLLEVKRESSPKSEQEVAPSEGCARGKAPIDDGGAGLSEGGDSHGALMVQDSPFTSIQEVYPVGPGREFFIILMQDSWERLKIPDIFA